MTYTTKDTAEGVRVTLAGDDITNPAAWTIMRAASATNRDRGAWKVKAKVLADVTAALDAWIADGRPAAGIAAGQHGPFEIGHLDGRYWVKSAKSFAPALKRIGGAWDVRNTRWIVGSEADLLSLITKSTKAAAAAGDNAWPEIKGLTINVRDDGTVGLAFAYDEALKNAVKALPTARWDADAKEWIVSVRYRAALRKKLVELASGFEAAAERRAADLAARIKTAEAVPPARHVPDPKPAMVNSPRSPAKPEPIARRPSSYEFHDRIKLGHARRRTDGSVIVVEEISDAFRGFQDIGSLGGHPEMEDEWVVRAYWRDATPEELNILENGAKP